MTYIIHIFDDRNELFYEVLNKLCQSKDAAEKCEKSGKVARDGGVDQSKILYNEKDLDGYMRD